MVRKILHNCCLWSAFADSEQVTLSDSKSLTYLETLKKFLLGVLLISILSLLSEEQFVHHKHSHHCSLELEHGVEAGASCTCVFPVCFLQKKHVNIAMLACGHTHAYIPHYRYCLKNQHLHTDCNNPLCVVQIFVTFNITVWQGCHILNDHHHIYKHKTSRI